jgi:hypothetical protein
MKPRFLIFLIAGLMAAHASRVCALDKAQFSSSVRNASSSTLLLKNSFIEVTIAGNGKFTIGTTGGDPTRSTDNDADLLYGHPYPGTTETMFDIDGATGTFGETGANAAPPAVHGVTATCAWDVVNNVRITQNLTLKALSTRNADTVEIKYTIENRDTVAHDAALRIQLDTLLGTNDGAPFRVFGLGAVTTDTEFDNDPLTAVPGIPVFCHVFDSLTNPKVFSMITPIVSGYRVPDRMVLGYWPVSFNKWDYAIIPGRSFTSDSSAIFWWGYPGAPITLAPGASVDLLVMYGLSNGDFISWSPFNIGIVSPSELSPSVSGGSYQYLPDPFIITAYFENTSGGNVTNATVALSLPTELVLYSDEQAIKYIEEAPGSRTVGQGKIVQISWKVKTYGRSIGDRFFSVTVNTGSGSTKITRTVSIDGIPNAVFGQVTDKDGAPVPGATVELLRGGVVISAMTSTAEGLYLFDALAGGDYEIRITKTGYPVSRITTTVSGEADMGLNPVLSAAGAGFTAYVFPNPVREGDARIRCFSTEQRDVQVKIFTTAGDLVRSFSMSLQANAWNELTWNITGVSNGVYFYKIEGAGVDKTGKIAVLKRTK